MKPGENLSASKAVEYIRRVSTQQPARKTWASFIRKEFTGPWYNADTPEAKKLDQNDRMPVNHMARLVTSYSARLFPNDLRLKVSPKRPDARVQAMLREEQLMHCARELNLARTLRMWGMDALLTGEGALAVGRTAGMNLLKVQGELIDPGYPFVKRIDPEDYVYDPDSRDRDEDSWRAYRYRTSRSWAMETGVVDPDMIAGLPTKRRFSGFIDAPADSMRQADTGQDQLFERVELWDIVIYDGPRVLIGTVAEGATDWLVPLHEYGETEGGPLHFLSFHDVPGVREALSPAHLIVDAHLAAAAMARKTVNMALAAKTIIKYAPAAQDDAEAIMDAPDLAMVATNNPDAIKADTLLPLNKDYLLAMDWLDSQVISRQSADLQTSTGAKGVADTATEAAILNQKSQGLMDDYAQARSAALKPVLRHIAAIIDANPPQTGFMYTDPATGYSEEFNLAPEDREDTYAEYSYDIVESAAGTTDPAMKAQQLLAAITQTAPAAQTVGMMAASIGGPAAGAEAMMKVWQIVGDSLGIEEFGEIMPNPMAVMGNQINQMLAGPQPGAGGASPMGMNPAGAPIPAPPQAQPQPGQRPEMPKPVGVMSGA